MVNRALLRQRASAQRAGRGAGTFTSPAPVGGWNKRDPEDAMPPTDAVVLDNFFPDIGRVVLRRGYASYATNAGQNDVESLMTFNDGGDEDFIAAGEGGWWNISAAGSATILASASSYSNNRWQSFMFAGKMGALNGANIPQQYDGSAVSNMPASGTGLTNTDLIGGIAYKERTYFWEISTGTNPTAFWYSATGALGGALTKFDMAIKAGFQGSVKAAGVWSRDSGDGLDDNLVFFHSDGTITVWNGTNPGDASAWSHVGTYKTGAPIDIRGVVRRGGELIVMTRAGYLPLTAIIQGGTAAIAISDKISGAVREAAENYASNFGWQAVEDPTGKALYFNVPVAEGGSYHQHVLNTLTGAWCRYTGIPARCFGIYGNTLYFGAGSGQVFQFDSGLDDNGSNRSGTARTAMIRMNRGNQFRVTSIRPQLKVLGTFSFSVGAEIDFTETGLGSNVYTASAGGPNWEDLDSFEWETWQDDWDQAVTLLNQWYSAQGIGTAAGTKITTSTKAEVEWFSTSFGIEVGGPV